MIHVDVKPEILRNAKKLNIWECWNGPERTCTKVDSTVSFFFSNGRAQKLFRIKPENVEHRPLVWWVWVRTVTANVTHLTDFTLNYMRIHISDNSIDPCAPLGYWLPTNFAVKPKCSIAINRAIISETNANAISNFLFVGFLSFHSIWSELVHCALSHSASSSLFPASPHSCNLVLCLRRQQVQMNSFVR